MHIIGKTPDSKSTYGITINIQRKRPKKLRHEFTTSSR